MIHYLHFIITNDLGNWDYVEKINHFPSFNLENDNTLWHFDGSKKIPLVDFKGIFQPGLYSRSSCDHNR